jgi:hypothetical protein
MACHGSFNLSGKIQSYNFNKKLNKFNTDIYSFSLDVSTYMDVVIMFLSDLFDC